MAASRRRLRVVRVWSRSPSREDARDDSHVGIRPAVPSGTHLGSIGRLGLKMLPAHEGPLSAVFDRNDGPAGGSGGWAVVLKTTARVILSRLGDELALPMRLVPVIRGGEGACHLLGVHMIRG